MLRRRISSWECEAKACNSVLVDVHYNAVGKGFLPALIAGRRFLKTLDVREYLPLAMPMEFRFYQRYTNHPNRQSGIQFLTHYNTHQRFRVNKDFIDYMNWGKEQGQARLPHRHQRVAFDFDDALHPTAVDRMSKEWFTQQDPTMEAHPDLSLTFDPNRKLFSHPEHWNKMFSKRRPGEGDIRLDVLDSNSLLGPLMTQTDTQSMSAFKVETRGPAHGKVPGVNTPFLGEFDRKLMQAMSRPLNKDRTITANNGRFSNTIFINDPTRHQVLSGELAKQLQVEVDRATNGVYSKLTVLEAAQSGQTDMFCGGADMELVGFNMQMAEILRLRAEEILSTGNLTKSQEREVEGMLHDATRYEDRADSVLRENGALIWRVHTAARPLMTLVNGKCRGTGCGLAFSSKFCGLKDTSEIIFDGPHIGVTPYGGLTRLLARPETSLKFPGLAEFVMLTGTSLFAGDALRLGWTDLFTTIPDMSYHIKDWFNASEHMHNDAVAWQLGHLLETCFKMKDAHSSAMERCAINPVRARWVEDGFADQPSAEAIVKTLGVIEKLPYADPHNTTDTCRSTPFTLESVEEGIRKLEQSRLRYTLSPWDTSAPEEEVEVRQAADIFVSYVLERRGTTNVVVHRDREKLRLWKKQREQEYLLYSDLRTAPHPRHIYARLEGCEGKLVDFDFIFNPREDAAKVEGEDAQRRATLDRLQRHVLRALGMPEDRDVVLGWYMPTLDTCPLYSDEQLMSVLHADPGIEDPQARLKYPPIYFIIKRNSLYFSEWAYAVKHQLLLQSPFALKASLEMLKEVRGDGSAESVLSLADALAVEFKYLSRLIKRPDFYRVGQHTTKPTSEWEAVKEEVARNIHKSYRPTRPLPDFEAVFERSVELDGHTFLLRPRWSPRTLEEVKEDDMNKLRAPLSFAKERIIPLDPAVQCTKADRLAGMIEDAGGYEVVAGLGEPSEDGSLKVEPLRGNAQVPTNVNFYEMARHPWDDTPSSWRRDGFTDGSKEYFEQQYQAAERAVYDEEGQGAYNYWPSKAAVDGTTSETANAELIQERLVNKLERAEREVENWARNLRHKALEGQLDYKTEIATQAEKIYDDEYYRWFIQPGHHPNPSGMLMNRKRTAPDASQDVELETFLNELLSKVPGAPVAEGVSEVEYGIDNMESEMVDGEPPMDE